MCVVGFCRIKRGGDVFFIMCLRISLSCLQKQKNFLPNSCRLGCCFSNSWISWLVCRWHGMRQFGAGLQRKLLHVLLVGLWESNVFEGFVGVITQALWGGSSTLNPNHLGRQWYISKTCMFCKSCETNSKPSWWSCFFLVCERLDPLGVLTIPLHLAKP